MRIPCEAQDLVFVCPEALVEIVDIGFGHAPALALLSGRNRRQFPFPLGQDGSVSFAQGIVVCFGQRLVLEFRDLVTVFEQQFVHAPGPDMVMGLDDVGEFAQEMGAAQGVGTLVIAEVGGPAVVDQDTAIAWDDADRLDCLDASFGMEDLERQGACGKDVDPVVLAFDTQRGLVDMQGRHVEQAFDGDLFPFGKGVVEAFDVTLRGWIRRSAVRSWSSSSGKPA